MVNKVDGISPWKQSYKHMSEGTGVLEFLKWDISLTYL